jgi:hypothetical protein
VPVAPRRKGQAMTLRYTVGDSVFEVSDRGVHEVERLDVDSDQPSAWEREQARLMLIDAEREPWLVRALRGMERWRPW